MTKTEFTSQSYTAHEQHYKDNSKVFHRLQNKGSIDYWRHERMFLTLMPFLGDKKNKWLTVGDGVGTDANWLQSQGVDVMASDISDIILKQAFELGYINNYSKQNAEQLTYTNNSFDYVFCKEAFHHFPRPYIALYEMIRVAQKAVVLIEPEDIGIQMPLIIFVKNILDRFSPQWINRIWKNRFSFEEVGNYVYKISEREIEKVAMGINLPCIAFKGINDYYSTTVDLSQPSSNRKVFNKVKRKIKLKNNLCRLGLIPYQLKTCVIFKSSPTEEEKIKMKAQGYKFVEMAINPYLNE
ncbi:Methyltransferase domain-containing protein [Saccharicrinis carchari]|uniref:Methyltransferase domain-containing protein n=1 Tax=Saccharicrinis carchari TaxID=1168039 RepID=A0A521CK04_SACCC|nr:class I SAM-dependent methyltransferase [Saccharicrinis carchari]SMO59071.1 Methyltransferase domain-containing protein [Saccharicrinis carchari]